MTSTPTTAATTATATTAYDIAKKINKAIDVAAKETTLHPIRSKVRARYSLKTLPAAIREYLVSSHKSSLKASRILRVVNGACVASGIKKIDLFDLYMLWAQLFNLRGIANLRPKESQAYSEYTIVQFAAFYRAWTHGGTSDVCKAAANTARPGLVSMSPASLKIMDVFASRMFTSMNSRGRVLAKLVGKSGSLEPTTVSEIDSAKEGSLEPLMLDGNKSVRNHIKEILSYAAVTRVSNIPSLVVPLETEVIISLRALSADGLALHGLLSAIQITVGGMRAVDNTPVGATTGLDAIAEAVGLTINTVNALPTGGNSRTKTSTIRKPEATQEPVRPAAKHTTQEVTAEDEPLFDSVDEIISRYRSAGDSDGDSDSDSDSDSDLDSDSDSDGYCVHENVDIDENIDIGALIQSAESAESTDPLVLTYCESNSGELKQRQSSEVEQSSKVDMGENRNGKVKYESIVLNDDTALEAAKLEAAKSAKLQLLAISRKAAEIKEEKKRKESDKEIPKILLDAEDNQRELKGEIPLSRNEKNQTKKNAEQKKEDANDGMIEAIKAERSVPMKERIGQSDILD